MKNFLVSATLIAACGVAGAKLPAPDDATKAKASEAAARSAWQGKVDAFQLCKSQDKVVSHYRKTAAAAPPAAQVAGTAPGAAAPAAAAPAAAAPAAAAPATTVAGGVSPGTCADPGPFAYTPTEQKPLEVSGAHSPAGTAVSPPSTNTPAAAIEPAKK